MGRTDERASMGMAVHDGSGAEVAGGGAPPRRAPSTDRGPTRGLGGRRPARRPAPSGLRWVPRFAVLVLVTLVLWGALLALGVLVWMLVA